MDSTGQYDWTGRRVLVTGAAGFIGSHLTERLVALGAQVTALDHRPGGQAQNLAQVRDRIVTIQCDLIRDDIVALLRTDRFDFIFHLAAGSHVKSSIDDPRRDFDRNAVATLNLLEGLRLAPSAAKVIYTSSATVYRGAGDNPIKEDDGTDPTTPYGVSKLAAERYISVYSNLFGIKAAILRLFSVYGQRLRKQIVFDLMSRLRADPNRLVLLGDGTEARDLSHVQDAVAALLLVATKAVLQGEAYNFACGHPVATLQLAKVIAQAMGATPTIEFSGRSDVGDTKCWHANTDKIARLGYKQSVTLEDGIGRTVEWFNAEIKPS